MVDPDEARLTGLRQGSRVFTRLGAAHARRRTLAAAIQASTRSMLPPLRHPGCASEATPAPGHGQPLAASLVAQVFNLCAFPVRGGLHQRASTARPPRSAIGSGTTRTSIPAKCVSVMLTARELAQARYHPRNTCDG